MTPFLLSFIITQFRKQFLKNSENLCSFSDGVNANQALKTTQGAFNCCSKLFSCLGEEGEIEDPTAE